MTFVESTIGLLSTFWCLTVGYDAPFETERRGILRTRSLVETIPEIYLCLLLLMSIITNTRTPLRWGKRSGEKCKSLTKASLFTSSLSVVLQWIIPFQLRWRSASCFTVGCPHHHSIPLTNFTKPDGTLFKRTESECKNILHPVLSLISTILSS
jgi:hypothetical protein